MASVASRHREGGGSLCLDRQKHVAYLHKGLKTLPESFSSLESSRPWILFWITHSLALLQAELPSNVTKSGIEEPSSHHLLCAAPALSKLRICRIHRTVDQLNLCQSKDRSLEWFLWSSNPCLADIAAFLLASQHGSGGLGGSPGQIPHLATTYAGVAAALSAGPEALAVLDRQAIFRFLKARCIPRSAGGGFEVCQGGVHEQVST